MVFYCYLVISSSSLWISWCNFISLACKSIWSIWWTFKCITTIAKINKIITNKSSWNSTEISYVLSSFNRYTWYASYTSSNRWKLFNKIIFFFNWNILMFIEAITFLGNQERDRNLYAIPGLDYVAHEDVIPYTVILFYQNNWLSDNNDLSSFVIWEWIRNGSFQNSLVLKKN